MQGMVAKIEVKNMRFIALIMLALLAGCAAFNKPAEEFACPKTGVIEEAANMTLLSPAGNEMATARLRGFEGNCSFKNNDIATVNLQVPLFAQKGVDGGELKGVEVPYFIALLSPDEQILQRQAFNAKIDFNNTEAGQSTEEHVVKIPVTGPGDAYKYKIVIGLALSPEQLEYNRARNVPAKETPQAVKTPASKEKK